MNSIIKKGLFAGHNPKYIAEGGLRTKDFCKNPKRSSLSNCQSFTPTQILPKSISQPLVTVITITLNAEDHIERTIQSVIDQSYDSIEYIIIDGGSSDKTVEIIKKYENQIDYWLSEPDNGISQAFNKGIDISTGSWICFLNAGDAFITNNIIKEVSGFFQDNYVITGFAKFGQKKIPKRLLKNSDKIHAKSMISHQASWVNREVFQNVGYFDEDFKVRMDYDFWLRALQEYNFMFIDSILVDYDIKGISGKELISFYYEECRANRKNIKNSFYINGISILKYVLKKLVF